MFTCHRWAKFGWSRCSSLGYYALTAYEYTSRAIGPIVREHEVIHERGNI